MRLDAVLMEQVLVNLLENAVRYTPEGTPIEVSARVRGDRVEADVADRGPGIPAGEEERIFSKFQRASDRADGGVGLGLAICRATPTPHDRAGGGVPAAGGVGAGGATPSSPTTRRGGPRSPPP